MKVKSESEVAQSCRTLRDPMDCSPPGSSAHGISQARLLEWVAIAFSRDQTMVEIMKIMATSFKRSHTRSAAPSAPDPSAGCRRPTPLLETPGHSRASLGLSLVGTLLLSPGSWCVHGFACALQGSEVSQFCVSSGGSMVGLMATSSKRACAIPRSAAPRAPGPVAGSL